MQSPMKALPPLAASAADSAVASLHGLPGAARARARRPGPPHAGGLQVSDVRKLDRLLWSGRGPIPELKSRTLAIVRKSRVLHPEELTLEISTPVTNDSIAAPLP